MTILSITLLIAICSLGLLADVSNGQESEQKCVNKLPLASCQRFQKFGLCYSRRSRMRKLCRQTCGFCGSVCLDVFKVQCKFWMHHQCCRTHRKLMKTYCRKTCKFCRSASPPQPPECNKSPFGCCWDRRRPAKGPNMEGCGRCKDRLVLCKAFWIDCYSERNQALMYQHCPKTCRLCSPKENKEKTVVSVAKKNKNDVKVDGETNIP